MENPEISNKEKFLLSMKLPALCILSYTVACHVSNTQNASLPSLPTDSSSQKHVPSDSEVVSHTLWAFLSKETLNILALSVTSLFIVTAAIYSAIGPRKHLLWRVLCTWSRLIMVWIYVNLLAISYILSTLAFLTFVAKAEKGLVLKWLVLSLAAFSSALFVAATMVASVIEVLEEDCFEYDDSLIEQEQNLILRLMEEAADEERNKRDDVVLGWSSSQVVNFLLVLCVCGIASYGLVGFFGVVDERKGGRMVMNTANTCLFLGVELLIFVVFIVFYWVLRKAKEEGMMAGGRGVWRLWLPVTMVLILLALDQQKAISYLDVCKVV